MRKLVILSAAVMFGGWLMSSAPAKAEMGCVCMGAKPMTCTSGLSACMSSGGLCVSPCDYATMTPAKATKPKKMSKKKS